MIDQTRLAFFPRVNWMCSATVLTSNASRHRWRFTAIQRRSIIGRSVHDDVQISYYDKRRDASNTGALPGNDGNWKLFSRGY